MATEVETPKPPLDLNLKPSEMNLPVIDETKPSCVKLEDVKESGECGLVGSPPEKKKCVKDRLKGLADKYVACLHAVDHGAGDMRGLASGPAMVPGPQPFESPSSSPEKA